MFIDSTEAAPACLLRPQGFAIPPIESSERAREREIAAYLSAASFPHGLPSGQPEEININADPVLNALVQLGALRLGTDRSFLSLIDRNYQYVVSEMTRSHSLIEVRSNPNETMFLGVAKLDAGYGVCPTTMNAFLDETGAWVRTGPNVIANRTRYIINDFRTDPDYSERPYVQNYPYFVSYLEVPLISPLGYLLGSYCVVDNKLHEFDDDETVDIMMEISNSIMTHLDLMRMKHSKQRSEQLINGLSGFVREVPPAPYPAPAPDADSRAAGASSLEAEGSAIMHGQNQASEGTDVAMTACFEPSLDLTRSPATVESPMSHMDSTLWSSVETQTPPTSPRAGIVYPVEQQAAGQDPRPNEHMQSQDSEPSESNLAEMQPSGFISSANIKSTFFRAAATIRQSMGMDGLTFVDAVPSSYAERSDQLPADLDEDSSPDKAAGPFCAAIVQSAIEVEGGERYPPSSQLRLPEPTLQRFIKRFPRGHVFSADTFGPIDESYGAGKKFPGGANMDGDSIGLRNDCATLFHALPSARYIVFLPLWHFRRECWYAAALGWISDPTRALDLADMGLITAFGNSVMAEVSHLEALAVSQAKSHFVSSISHELRSPLHGIMASSELLREAVSDPFLLSTLDMIDSCGKTLLDTFSNLLDHATVIGDGKNDSVSASNLQHVDLADLVEDVVEAVNFSYISENTFVTSMHRQGLNPTELITHEESSTNQPVLVTVNIARRPSWEIPLDKGAWKRIVMNIFGNARKYTTAGHIDINLSVVLRKDRGGNRCEHIYLSVADTGCGMSSDYLKYRLFTPFSQENPHSPGTGLGLSIVQQLVVELGGDIDVKSAVGNGTNIGVFVPLHRRSSQPTTPTQVANASNHPVHYSDCHPGLHERKVCFITSEAYPALANNTHYVVTNEMRSRSAALEKTLKINAGDALGLSIVVATAACPAPDADVYVIDGVILDNVAGGEVGGNLPPWCSQLQPLVVLDGSTTSNQYSKHSRPTSYGIYLQDPIGPRKLASTLLSILEGRSQREDSFPAYTEMQSAEPQIQPSRPQDPGQPCPPIKSLPPPEPPMGLAKGMPPPPQKSRHILLVDDNPINLKLLTAIVGKLKHHTFATARHGLEAVQQYVASVEQRRPFDLVFMDITMPVMDGFEATREIRKAEKKAGIVRPCTVVALTGLAGDASRREAIGSGCNQFLTKPVRLEKVRSLLDEEP